MDGDSDRGLSLAAPHNNLFYGRTEVMSDSKPSSPPSQQPQSGAMTGSRILIVLTLILSALAAIISSFALLVATDVISQHRSLSTSFDVQARTYLLDHPEVVLESIQRLDEKNKAAENDEIQTALRENRAEIFNSASSPVAGNPNGDVTLVEFFDYNCPYCRKAEPILGEAVAADKGLRVVYKEWPILGPGSEFAARAALASKAQGKYEAFHQAMMTSSNKVDEVSTLEIAHTIGLNVEQLKRDMADPAVKTELERNFALAEKLRITGTPAFIIGDEIIRGLVDLAALQQSLASARLKTGG
jgi:protein-disulfide isomerase